MPSCFLSHRAITGGFVPCLTKAKGSFVPCLTRAKGRIDRKSMKVVRGLTYLILVTYLIYLNLIWLNLENFDNYSENGGIKSTKINFKTQNYTGHIFSIIKLHSINNKQRNKNQYTLNGNKSIKTSILKIIHWNKGPSDFFKDTTKIENNLQKYKPDIVSLSEANIHINKRTFLKEFKDYNVETALMAKITGISRSALLIKKGIKYKRRENLENQIISTIWIEVITKNKPILIASGYRQWQTNKKLKINNSKTPKKQMERFKIWLELWNKALREKRNTIYLTDDNLDSGNSKHNVNYNIKNLQNELNLHLDSNKLTIHNNSYTFFNKKYGYSIIDHVYTNCPKKIDEVKTVQNSGSDHALLKFNYSCTDLIPHQNTKIIRNWKNCTKTKLLKCLEESTIMNTLFHYTDPNLISTILQNELSNIVNCLAPPKTINYETNYAPYLNKNLREKQKSQKAYIKRAIASNNINDWREYRNFQNSLTKEIKIEKSILKKNLITLKKYGTT